MTEANNGIKLFSGRPASGNSAQKPIIIRFPESERSNSFVRAFINGIEAGKKQLAELNVQLDGKQSELVSLCVEIERSIGVLMQNAELVRTGSKDAEAFNALLHRLNLEHASIRNIRHLSSTSKSALNALFDSEKTVNGIKYEVAALETRLRSEQAAKSVSSSADPNIVSSLESPVSGSEFLVPGPQIPVSSAEEPKPITQDTQFTLQDDDGSAKPEVQGQTPATSTPTEAQPVASESAQVPAPSSPEKDAEIVLANGAALATPSFLREESEESLEIKRMELDEKRKAAVREVFMIMVYFGYKDPQYDELMTPLSKLVFMGDALRDGFAKRSVDPDDVLFYLDSLSKQIDEVIDPIHALHDDIFNVLTLIRGSRAGPGSNVHETKGPKSETEIPISTAKAQSNGPDRESADQTEKEEPKPRTDKMPFPLSDAKDLDDWYGRYAGKFDPGQMCSGDIGDMPDVVIDMSDGVDYLGAELDKLNGKRKRRR